MNGEEESVLKKWLEDNGYELDYKIELNEVWKKEHRTLIRHPVIGLRSSYCDPVNEEQIKEFLKENDKKIKKILN